MSAPIVFATPAPVPGGWRVRCPHCGALHAHGGQPGHRVGDCPAGTVGREQGYVVAPPQPAEAVS